MKIFFTGIGIMLCLLFASCGGHGTSHDDSADWMEEGDSILIDESTNLAVGKTEENEDSVKVVYVRFKDAGELKDYLRNSSDRMKYLNGIIPLVADKSLEYAEKLVNNQHEGFIIVDKSRMKVIYFDKYGREKLSYGMACAKKYGNKHAKADSRTPEGFFTAAGVYDSTDWLFTDDDGKTSDKKGQFGPRFIRLRCPNTSQIGIHGTCSPWTIGHRSSHGCIRVTNENIMELVEYVTVGMPIIVVPGRRDMEVNAEEGFESIWIPTSFDAKEPKVKDVKPKTEDEIQTEEKKAEEEKKNDDEMMKPRELPADRQDDEPVATPASPDAPEEPAPSGEPEGAQNPDSSKE